MNVVIVDEWSAVINLTISFEASELNLCFSFIDHCYVVDYTGSYCGLFILINAQELLECMGELNCNRKRLFI